MSSAPFIVTAARNTCGQISLAAVATVYTILFFSVPGMGEGEDEGIPLRRESGGSRQCGGGSGGRRRVRRGAMYDKPFEDCLMLSKVVMQFKSVCEMWEGGKTSREPYGFRSSNGLQLGFFFEKLGNPAIRNNRISGWLSPPVVPFTPIGLFISFHESCSAVFSFACLVIRRKGNALSHYKSGSSSSGRGMATASVISFWYWASNSGSRVTSGGAKAGAATNSYVREREQMSAISHEFGGW